MDNPNSLENVTFDASESKDLDTEIKAWNWDFGDGGKGEGKTAIHSYHQGGSFPVTLTVTDNDDVEKSSKHTKAIEVNGLPIPVIEYTPIDPQLDDAIDFDASQSRDPDPQGSIKSYYWEFDDGETSTRMHPSPHKYESNGSYAVSLTVEDDKGAAAKTSVIVKVNLPPSANFIITPHEKERYNVGERIVFNASSSYDLDGTIKNWSWDFDDIAAPEEGEIVEHSFSSGGNHTVKLIVQDIDNATDEYSKIIYINSLPVPVISMQRAGTFVKFSGLDSYDQEGGTLKYRWDFENDGIDDSGLPNPDKQYLSNANYTVKLTVIDENGASNSTIMDIFIEKINQAPVLESLSADMSSPQQAGTAITWTAFATDSENDPLVYRFLIRSQPTTDWQSSSIWTWSTSESIDIGSNLVEVQVRDGNHARSESYDSSVSREFTINAAEPEGPKTFRVGSGNGYSKVQDAIDAASEGDTIEVHSGTYYEHITVNKKLTLMGMDTGNGRPILDAGGSGTSLELNANGISLTGFVIRNAGSVYPDAGLAVSSSENSITSNDVIDNAWYGICIKGSNNELTGNTISGNKVYGLVLMGSSYNSIYDNKIRNNGHESNSGGGIALHDSSTGNTIRNNEVSQNIPDGISIYDSNNNIINENEVKKNSWNGIRVQGYSLTIAPSGNTITKNDLVDNGGTYGEDAYDVGVNQWDDGTTGNYYSENSCTNANNDFYCDSPYSVPGGSNADNHPLASPLSP
jgi:parallel beta-helix repeat protein